MNMNFDDGNERPKEPPKGKSRESDEPCRVEPKAISDISINPTDVLCGRGKLSFNHGKYSLQEDKINTFLVFQPAHLSSPLDCLFLSFSL